ncbi:MAG: tetratricopeptide repeat protein [Cyanobacteria bacterium P01_H01_bin.105]
MLLSTTKTFSKNHCVNSLDGDAHRLLHQAMQHQDYSRAISILNQLIHQDSNNSEYYSNRGLIYYRCRKWSHAIVDYNQALRLNPNNDRTYARRARCNTALKQWHEAIADYDSAININPYNIQARINQGILFRALRMYDEAIVCFGLALFLGKLSIHVYAERGRTYHLDEHWNCAMGDYQKALKLLNQSPNQSLELKIKTWLAELLANQ